MLLKEKQKSGGFCGVFQRPALYAIILLEDAQVYSYIFKKFSASVKEKRGRKTVLFFEGDSISVKSDL